MTIETGSVSIEPGAKVLSADGKQLGVVKEAQADSFKVNARWASDYWLGTELVDSVDNAVVWLLITAHAVSAAKLRVKERAYVLRSPGM